MKRFSRKIALATAMSASSLCFGSDLRERFKTVCNAPNPVLAATVKAIDSELDTADVNELSSVELADIQTVRKMWWGNSQGRWLDAGLMASSQSGIQAESLTGVTVDSS